MKFFLFSMTCIFLKATLQNPTDHWTLLPHILVVQVDGGVGQLPLSCLASLEELTRGGHKSEDIFWMKNGAREAQRGNSYVVQLEESLGGGNYSCYNKEGALLNHTVVLIQEDKTKRRKILMKNDHDSYLKCSARNFSGAFRCSWTWHSSRVGKVSFIEASRVSYNSDTQCSVDASGNQWTCSSAESNFMCSVDDSGRSISCLDQNYCAYAEESGQICINVFVSTQHFLTEYYTTCFFLSEIVRPDKVTISKVNKTMIAWGYPSSWNIPFSYFPLTFQIARIKRLCKRCDNPCTESRVTKTSTVPSTDICQLQVKHKTKAVCIRAKDALCGSEWSEWSFYRFPRRIKDTSKTQRMGHRRGG